MTNALQRDKQLLTSFDVATEFHSEATQFQSALATSLDESLALFDGKWLLRHFLVEKFPKAKPDGLCQEWITHAATSGGLPEVCDLWQRITGSPP